ncbi:TonB-dependent receptor [Sphingomonas sp. ASV193]|uniref:TonB-dependent receptor n=1 Tax=Sphingomonas sp. ASV193 TaxID=3144405 RepID=UPI0032E86B29
MTDRSIRRRRASLLAGGCGTSLLALFAAAPALAQDAAPAPATAATPAPAESEGQAIVVTGVRASIRNSIAIKRRESSIVEAVSAEDIGKLPDQSIAESIARLPGLAAQRTNGRANIVSVRGFGPDFSTVLLNGRPQASSGYNRAVEFDQYPSELLSSVVVYKSPDAAISGMGLAGTVDLRTVRPLSYGKPVVAVNLRGQLDSGGGRNGMSKYGWRGSASIIGKNHDGTIGWSLGYAHLDAPSHVNHTKDWFYGDYGNGVQTLSGQEIRSSNSRDIRDGVMGTLEFRPSDRVHSVLDLYYSRFKQRTTTRGAEWFSSAWTDGVTYSDVQTKNRGGVIFDVADHVTNVAPVIRWDEADRTDHLFSAGLNNDFRVAEHTHLLTDLSYSSNKRVDHDVEIFGGYGVGPAITRVFDSYDRTIPQDGFLQVSNFGLDYADANQVSLGDRSAWGGYGSDGHYKAPRIKETVVSGEALIRQDLQGGFFSSIEGGFDYTHRNKHKTVDELDLFLKNGRQQQLIDSQYLTDPTSLSFAGDMSVLGVNVDQLLNSGRYYDIVQLQDANHYDKSWQIKEGLLTFKVKANIDSGNLHGNVGVQYVDERQSSSGLRIDGTGGNGLVVTPQTITAHYHDVLPSLNLSYDLDDKSKLRFAAAQVMARPRMDDMRANLVPGYNGSVCSSGNVCTPGQVVHPWSASGGNPNLRPWRAKELDVAYEWYSGKATYFSVNAFYMHLDNYIYQQAIEADFSNFTIPPTAPALPAGVVYSPIGQLTTNANGKGGRVLGVEISGALELNRFLPALDGFGLLGSISLSDSKVKPEVAAQLPRLPGFSKTVYNITAYYEKYGFQARASYRYRSAFEGEAPSLFANLGFPSILADKQLDAQVGYTFADNGPLHGLGIQLQLNNVLDSPYRTAYDVNGIRTLENYEKYGRQWLLGFSKRF